MADEPADQRVLRLWRHARADLLLGQANGKLGRVTLELHAGGLARRSDLLLGMRLDLGDLGNSGARETARFGLRLARGLGAERGNFRFQAGQAPVDFGGARFGLLAQVVCLQHVFPDLAGPRRKERSGILLHGPAQEPREHHEIGPLPQDHSAALAFGGTLGGLLLGGNFFGPLLLGGRRHYGGNRGEKEDQGKALHAALRRRTVSAICEASWSLCAASEALAASASCANCCRAASTAASERWRASAICAAAFS